MFCYKNFLKSLEIYYVENGLDPSITYIVEAMNTLLQERDNQSENCIRVEMFQKTQKVDIYVTNERSSLAFFSTDLGHILEVVMAMNLV